MRRELAGGGVWLVAAVVTAASPFDVSWARLLLVFAALVLVPLGLRFAPTGKAARHLLLPAALLLGLAQLLDPGLVAASLALPWLATTGLIAVRGLARSWSRGLRFSAETCLDAALVYLAVGGAWAVSDRLGFRPLDFDPVIVLLTAIHFHYAGFVLPLVCGLALNRAGGLPIGAAVVAGVPTVAVGITATQLGFSPLIESLAAWFLALGGIGVAVLHLRLASASDERRAPRVLWGVAGASLLLSMVLAALYATRFFAALEWLDIPWMRALHGTANALGFSLASLLAWTPAKKRPDMFPPGSM